jgi:hypothetical protein
VGLRIVSRVKLPQVYVLPQATEAALAQMADVIENNDADLQDDIKTR